MGSRPFVFRLSVKSEPGVEMARKEEGKRDGGGGDGADGFQFLHSWLAVSPKIRDISIPLTDINRIATCRCRNEAG